MATAAPRGLEIRVYQVGFGDCFLLSFAYAAGERHVLIDFGSMGLPDGAADDQMRRIADDIAARTGGKLHAVVATHRHRDHIGGFATTKKKDGPGDIIRGLRPDVVVQPWTEDPKAARDAAKPTATVQRSRSAMHLRSLDDMAKVAELVVRTAGRLEGALGVRGARGLAFIGEDNLPNLSAVRNLQDIAPERRYVHFGSRSGLERLLPGVRVHVLGPPTLEQTDTIRKQRREDQDEFWHFWRRQAVVSGGLARGDGGGVLFPDAVLRGTTPRWARWFQRKALEVHGESLFELVRILDKAMNNTSVILLFEVGDQRLLFRGDAQIENWAYALSQDKVRALLRGVTVYKVGHHGSLNATPKESLWPLFARRSPARGSGRLTTLLSTLGGQHGEQNEVPRQKLVDELDARSDLFTTEKLAAGGFKPADASHPLNLTFRKSYAQPTNCRVGVTEMFTTQTAIVTFYVINYCNAANPEPVLNFANDIAYKVALHEIGHTVGLGDLNPAQCSDLVPGQTIMNVPCAPGDPQNMMPAEPTPCDKNTLKDEIYSAAGSGCGGGDVGVCRQSPVLSRCMRDPICCPSPIVFDLLGDGYNLTSVEAGVAFDLDADGQPDQCAWSAAGEDEVWLALDRNENSMIDDGSELFGDHTPQPFSDMPNGFLALAVFDTPQNGGDGDGWITPRDAIYSHLRLWHDADHDGISTGAELNQLADAGVSAISLRYRELRLLDENGNWFRFRARVLLSRRPTAARWAYDVYLGVAPQTPLGN